MRVKLGDYIKEYSVKNKNNEDIPVYSVSNSLGFCKDYFGKEVASKNKTTYKIVPRGCFAYNPSRINVGSVDWQNEEERVIVSPLYNVFSVSPLLDQQYLLYYLKSNVVLSRIRAVASGSVRDNLKLSMLYEFPIDLISLEQQYDVVSTLNAVQKIIDLYQKELSGLDELVRARFVEMFGRPTDKITRYPKVKIGNLIKEGKASIKAGPFGSSLKKEFYVKKGFKIYGQEQVIKNDPTFGDYYINEDRFNSLKSCEVHAGDILISLVGTCGKTMIMPENFEPGIINPRLLKIAFDAEFIISIYFKYFFGSDDLQKILNSASGHSTMNVVNAGMLKNVELIMAPIELQNQFASFVEEIDKSRLLSNHSLFLIKSIIF